MVQVFISIGSNVDREQNIRSAVAALRERWGRLTLSPVYESAPVGFRGGNFYNLVAGLDTRTPVARLFDELAALERAHGRVPAPTGLCPARWILTCCFMVTSSCW